MRFLPREEKFFELFLSQVRLISQSADLLVTGLDQGYATLESTVAQITELEHQADSVLAEVFQRLNQTFITPLDPEDIHSLSMRLDDVIDGIEDLAQRIVDYRIDPIPDTCNRVAADIRLSVAALERAFEALRDGGNVKEHCVEVGRIEEEVDNTVRLAIRDLFDQQRDPILIIKLKEVYDLLEATTDFCDDVSVALQNVVVKNS